MGYRLLIDDAEQHKRSPLLDSFYGTNTNPHSWCYFGSSSSKSTPVINQPGLNALNANIGQANNVANSLGTYGGLLSAPLAGNQMQAINAAPQMGQIGAPQLNFAANTDANLTGYRAPQAGTAYAAPGLLGGAATYNPTMLGAAPMATPGLMGAPATSAAGLAGPAATANSPSISGLMGGFMSPYTQNVVNTTNAQIEQQRERAAMANNQDATAAGAFGGNRQGVSDALTNQLYDLDTAQTDAQLNQAGFNTALQGATQQAANNLNAGQFNAGQQNQIGLFNAGNQQQANLFNAGNAQQTGLFNAGNVQETNLANQGLAGIYGQANQNAANVAGGFNAGALNTALGINAGNVQQANLANAGAANNMAQFNVGSNLAGAGIQQNAANSLAGASGQMQQQFGNYITALLNTGQIDQATVQNNLSNLYNQFLQQQQTAIQGQSLVNQSLGLVPASLGQNSKASGFNFTSPITWSI